MPCSGHRLLWAATPSGLWTAALPRGLSDAINWVSASTDRPSVSRLRAMNLRTASSLLWVSLPPGHAMERTGKGGGG